MSYHFDPPSEPIDNPGNWRRGDLDAQGATQRFSAAHLREIDAAVKSLRARGLQAPHFTSADFPLPETGALLAKVRQELEDGYGFALLQGIALADYGRNDAENIFWGIAMHLGVAVPQNADAHLIGHVRDLGYDLKNPTVRNYQTTEELLFHNDSCDVLGLMCLQPAKSGGRSAIASAVAVHNTILERHPELLRELYQPLCIDRRGELGWPDEGDEPYFALPVYCYHEGYLTARYTVRAYYFEAQRFAGVKPLTDLQAAAINCVPEIAAEPEFHITYDLQPGDLQFVNNYCVFHSRTHFEDFSEAERKRHLLRVWLATSNSRPLHPIFEKRFRSIEPGAIRGGIAPRRETATA